MLFNFFFLVSFGFKFDCSLSILLKALRLLEKKPSAKDIILFYFIQILKVGLQEMFARWWR